jgi:hypothetical protein
MKTAFKEKGKKSKILLSSFIVFLPSLDVLCIITQLLPPIKIPLSYLSLLSPVVELASLTLTLPPNRKLNSAFPTMLILRLQFPYFSNKYI